MHCGKGTHNQRTVVLINSWVITLECFAFHSRTETKCHSQTVLTAEHPVYFPLATTKLTQVAWRYWQARTQHNTTTNTTRDAHNNLKRLCHLNQTNSIALPFLGVGSSVYLHPPCFHSIFPKSWSLRWPAEKSGSTDLSVKMGQPEFYSQ